MRTRAFSQLVRTFAQQPPAERAASLRKRLQHHAACPVASYLMACHCIDQGRMATGVRHFMVAHHSEPQLQSAAVLVFAGLAWSLRQNEELLPVLLDTWEEFRRPHFDQLPRERLLLDAFDEAEPGLDAVSPLARGLWRLPIKTLRSQIRLVVASGDRARYPLLVMSA